ncbi:hypothetical protein CFP56_007012 [Quercus suber]|uniref:Uncharacterized protein n=1 Tax=Quercus suber TaxID=58331 RepID=A0AAW0LA35_QUESU
MNMSKGNEEVNEQSARETKVVETVDYQSHPGEDREPTKEAVHVVHLTRDNKRDSSFGGGKLASAAASVASTIRSAKDAILGTGKDNAKK